ncbi:hypothetical protein [Pseudomonas sp. Hp2]|uniref:spermine/spermidine synthase domain-containing protein n=1 Tax=Pseudomonas sp. Hp2 TaxID=701189 RepID=UPI001C498417|nr:hypothetical protein [Pseudomonas sp. Hp2]
MKWMPRGVAFLVGAASLVQEVLWMRLAGLASGGLPEVFGIVLALYLFGMAIGAQLGRRLCRNEVGAIRYCGAMILFLSALFDVLAPFLFAWSISFLPVMLAVAPLVILTAALKSVMFPIVHHLGSNDAMSWKGISFSRVYFANVLGCTMGPLLVTLWAMDLWSMEQLFAGVAVVTAAAAGLLMGRWYALAGMGGGAVIGVMLVPYLPGLAGRVVEATGGTPVAWLLERKEGVIHTIDDPLGDIVFGGNVYDGRINIDLRRNSNRIDRVYAAMISSPSPKKVLVIGLSGGSWTRVIASFPTVQQVDVIEINPGYLELIARYSEVAPILSDPRVHIYIDDGRRWLRMREAYRYDAIIVNSTFHWRSGATTLLSREFFHLLSRHLTDSGIALINATGSPEVLKTVKAEFAHAYQFGNSVIMSQQDFRAVLRAGAEAIYRTRLDGRIVFDARRKEDAEAVRRVVEGDLRGLDVVEREVGRSAEINTDLRMLTEYKYGASSMLKK